VKNSSNNEKKACIVALFWHVSAAGVAAGGGNKIALERGVSNSSGGILNMAQRNALH